MLEDGKFVNSIDLNLSTEEIKDLIKAPIYTQLIPRAWRMSNLPFGPFILDLKERCTSDGVLDNSDGAEKRLGFSEEMLKTDSYCHDGNLFILTPAANPWKHCSQTDETSGSCFEPFQQLPGVEQLDGKKWGKVTPKDISITSVNTWLASDKSNTGEGIDLDTEFAKVEHYRNLASNDIIDKIMETGIHTPELVLLPVCDSYEANEGWENAYNSVGGQSLFHPWANYPCK